MIKKLFFTMAAGVVVLASACSSSAPGSTATTIPPVPTPTPMVTQEWKLLAIAVDGDSVAVSLGVFAGIDVDVTLDGTLPSRIDSAPGQLEFVFEYVAVGEHAIVISDVVGFNEAASVTVAAPDPDGETFPDWLAQWIADLEAGNVEFPPLGIYKFQEPEKIVYYVKPQCCDQFSDLLDADGNLIGHPDGGIIGAGDGVTIFSPSDFPGEEIWPRR